MSSSNPELAVHRPPSSRPRARGDCASAAWSFPPIGGGTACRAERGETDLQLRRQLSPSRLAHTRWEEGSAVRTRETGCRFMSLHHERSSKRLHLRSPVFNRPSGLGLLAEAHRRASLLVCPALPVQSGFASR